MMHWIDHGWGMGYGWGMGFGWMFVVIFWALVIIGIVYLITLAAGGKKRTSEESPLDILKRRYAKGEISREEFEKMKDDLKKE